MTNRQRRKRRKRSPSANRGLKSDPNLLAPLKDRVRWEKERQASVRLLERFSPRFQGGVNGKTRMVHCSQQLELSHKGTRTLKDGTVKDVWEKLWPCCGTKPSNNRCMGNTPNPVASVTRVDMRRQEKGKRMISAAGKKPKSCGEKNV